MCVGLCTNKNLKCTDITLKTITRAIAHNHPPPPPLYPIITYIIHEVTNKNIVLMNARSSNIISVFHAHSICFKFYTL